MKTLVGGRERQNYPLADMMSSADELAARLSQDMTLEPGDVILCGTSLGVLPMNRAPPSRWRSTASAGRPLHHG